MEIAELFARLESHRGPFPTELIEEVIFRREETVPAFLEILADIEKNPESWLADQDRMIHIYAMYALALFRETRAYPLLVQIFSRPGEFPFDLSGDVVTQNLDGILASVCGGDTGGIQELIENAKANEYVRASAMQAMVLLVNTGQITRDVAVEYFLQLFQKFERKPGYEWSALANVCCDLWPHEAMGELRQAYEEDLVDPADITLEDIERELALGKGKALAQIQCPLITDLAFDMGWMQCFESPKRESTRTGNPFAGFAVATVQRSTPKVGRNDPCPCGSGKKFKKCCGAN
jgi:hypothetical protein